jgi:putative photosynthetic complex assembly protein 2
MLLPALYAAFVWWFSTGVIILLDNLPPRSFRWSMLAGSLVMVAALAGIAVSAADAGLAGAYLGFTCGVLVWGWQEMSFFMGFVTGPRRVGCAADCAGWARFRAGVAACLHHELAIIGFALVVVALSRGQPSQTGCWTFLTIWALRQSAKLNVFLGVRHLGEEFLPPHLHYLRSFMRQRAMNALMPFSLAAAGVAFALVLRRAAMPGLPAAEAAGLTLIATMLGLGVLEHALMVAPLPLGRLWHWAVRARRPARREEAATAREAKLRGAAA